MKNQISVLGLVIDTTMEDPAITVVVVSIIPLCTLMVKMTDKHMVKFTSTDKEGKKTVKWVEMSETQQKSFVNHLNKNYKYARTDDLR